MKMKKLIIILILASGLIIGLSHQRTEAQQTPDFDLNWSTNTYISPDYPGKALPITNSRIKVTAIPTAKLVDNESTFTYNWFLDDRFIRQFSGEGKTTFNFLAKDEANYVYHVKVRILDKNARFITQKDIFIKLVKPESILKVISTDTPIGNLLANTELFIHTTGDLKIQAIPYFFNANPTNLDFSWQLDNQTLSDPTKKNPDFLTLTFQDIKPIFTKNLSWLITNKDNPNEKSVNQLNVSNINTITSD